MWMFVPDLIGPFFVGRGCAIVVVFDVWFELSVVYETYGFMVSFVIIDPSFEQFEA